MKDKNINIYSLKWDFKNLRHTFWAHTNRSKMLNYFKIFLPQEAGAFGSNMEKESQSHAQNWKNMHPKYIYREYLLCLQSDASVSFFQKFINFVEQRLKFPHCWHLPAQS